MAKKIGFVLLMFVLSDIGYSFYQHYTMPLYGEMAQIIMPDQSEECYWVLHDPFGFSAIFEGKTYANPNRFFAHWTTSEYFLTMPGVLQSFVSPIVSVYLSSAIAKTLMQILILYLLAVYISGVRTVFRLDFLVAAAIVTPLIQNSGYSRSMGIIDPSVVYAFAYALPLGLLLLLFLPFLKSIYNGTALKFNLFTKIVLALSMIFLALNGPLISGVVLIVCPLIIINIWLKNFKKSEQKSRNEKTVDAIRKIPSPIMYFCLGFCLLCFYSLYLGQKNSLKPSEMMPLLDRYSLLPSGIYNLIAQKLGLPLLLLMIVSNIYILKTKFKSEERDHIIVSVKWIGIFILLYVLLLPLGGYRCYRENIIRYDTFLPVTLCLIYIYGRTSFYLLKNSSQKLKNIFIPVLFLFSAIFLNADRIEANNKCEKQALVKMSESTAKIVELDADCPVMEWHMITDYKKSELNARLFYYWNITKEKKLYFQHAPE